MALLLPSGTCRRKIAELCRQCSEALSETWKKTNGICACKTNFASVNKIAQYLFYIYICIHTAVDPLTHFILS